MNYTICNSKGLDIDSLKRFFIKTYGEKTIFQDIGFLDWFFNSSLSMAARDKKGEVVAHYGGIKSSLVLNNSTVSLIWGVNAYTLPEWRNQGINSLLVKNMMDKCDIFGVINFTPKTALFYSTKGFNIFKRQRFKRYVLNLDRRTFDIVKKIKGDYVKARDMLKVISKNFFLKDVNKKDNIVVIKKDNLDGFSIAYDYSDLVTTQRDLAHIKWRFLDNPYINYQCIACVSDNKILAFVVVRREQLYPTEHYISRIVDLFGKEDYIYDILQEVLLRAGNNGDIFIDFYSFGTRYRDILDKFGFVLLRDEDISLLPQVTAPIENRPNFGYIGLFSSKYKNEILDLDEEKAFFTRADSDMDRLNNIDQIATGIR